MYALCVYTPVYTLHSLMAGLCNVNDLTSITSSSVIQFVMANIVHYDVNTYIHTVYVYVGMCLV